ncbi:MAG: hypothetical protein ACR2K2_01830 [Mycobacteriales bacterium]
MGIYDEVFAALHEADVRYVVVGGVAVVLQGHARMTVDLDLVVDLAVEPAGRTIDALLALGLRSRLPVEPSDFARPDVRADWVANRNMQVFSMYDPSNPFREVDLFAAYPLPFEELWADSDEVVLRDVAVRVASIPHLLRLKPVRRPAPGPARHPRAPRPARGEGPTVTTHGQEDDWSAGSFQALAQQQRRDVANSSASRRLAWLEEALLLAQASGALRRARDARQRECEKLWYGDISPAPSFTGSTSPGSAGPREGQPEPPRT